MIITSDTALRAQIAIEPILTTRITSIQQHGLHGETVDALGALTSTVSASDLAWAVAGNTAIFTAIKTAVEADSESNAVATAVAAVSDNDLIYAVTQATKRAYGLA